MAPPRKIDQLLHETTVRHKMRAGGSSIRGACKLPLALKDILGIAQSAAKKRLSKRRRRAARRGLGSISLVLVPLQPAAGLRILSRSVDKRCKGCGRRAAVCSAPHHTAPALYALETRGQHPLQRLRTQSSRIQQRKNDACT